MSADNTVSFTQMKDGTRDDYMMLHELEKPYLQGTADRLLREMRNQADETLSGYRITRLEHGLQSATRARRDGADIDWVVSALLHDIGHYEWYTNGQWDYEKYRQNDIHAIKGAERAHKLLIRLGEEPQSAKEIALAILLHTDSYLPEGTIQQRPLQKVVKLADEADEEPGGKHHYREMEYNLAVKKIKELDKKVLEILHSNQFKQLG